MLNHDTLGVPIAREIMQRLRIPNAIAEDVLFLVEYHMYDLNFRARESTLRTRFASIGYDRALLLCAIREADVLGSGLSPYFRATRWRTALDAMKKDGAPFSESELACTGRDLMEWLNLPPANRSAPSSASCCCTARGTPRTTRPSGLKELLQACCTIKEKTKKQATKPICDMLPKPCLDVLLTENGVY